MALCTSCGSEVDESASFCTSCGQRMSTSNAGATITVTRPICSSCGAQVDSGSVFCTNCGHRMAQPSVMEETAPAQAEPAPVAATAPPLTTAAAPTPASPSTSSSSAVCRSCGATLAPESSFCVACGQPRSGSDATTAAPAGSVMATRRAAAMPNMPLDATGARGPATALPAAPAGR